MTKVGNGASIEESPRGSKMLTKKEKDAVLNNFKAIVEGGELRPAEKKPKAKEDRHKKEIARIARLSKSKKIKVK